MFGNLWIRFGTCRKNDGYDTKSVGTCWTYLGNILKMLGTFRMCWEHVGELLEHLERVRNAKNKFRFEKNQEHHIRSVYRHFLFRRSLHIKKS